MAHIGNRPDCVHCRFMQRQANGVYHCRQHNIALHTPISLYCKQISLPEEITDETQQVWFEEHIQANKLEPNTLYTWVETHLREKGKSSPRFNGEKLAAIPSYLSWSAGIFWQALRNLRQAVRDGYRQHGFEVDE